MAGASTEEVHEALDVAIAMDGGPSVMYTADAAEAFGEFMDAKTAGSSSPKSHIVSKQEATMPTRTPAIHLSGFIQ